MAAMCLVVVSSKGTLRRPNVPSVTKPGQFFVPATVNRDLRDFPTSVGVDGHCPHSLRGVARPETLVNPLF